MWSPLRVDCASITAVVDRRSKGDQGCLCEGQRAQEDRSIASKSLVSATDAGCSGVRSSQGTVMVRAPTSVSQLVRQLVCFISPPLLSFFFCKHSSHPLVASPALPKRPNLPQTTSLFRLLPPRMLAGGLPPAPSMIPHSSCCLRTSHESARRSPHVDSI